MVVQQFTAYLEQAKNLFQLPSVPEQDLQAALAQLGSFATGVQAIVILTSGLVNLLFARWWQANLFNPGGLRQELYNIRLNKVFSVVLLAGVMLGMTGFGLFVDFIPVIALGFIIGFLSLVHNIFAQKQFGWSWYILFYTVFLYGVLSPFGLIFIGFVMLISLTDSVLHLREAIEHGNYLTRKNS